MESKQHIAQLSEGGRGRKAGSGFRKVPESHTQMVLILDSSFAGNGDEKIYSWSNVSDTREAVR